MGLKLIATPTVEPVTLSEAKLHLRVDGSDEDALIGAQISAAREEAEQVLQRACAPQTLLLTLDAFPDGAVLLPMPPVSEILSVKYTDEDGAEQTLAPNSYAIDDAQLEHWLVPAYGETWPIARDEANAVRITYRAGWSQADCPASVKNWLLLRIGTLYAHREADSDKPAMPSAFADRLVDRFRVIGL